VGSSLHALQTNFVHISHLRKPNPPLTKSCLNIIVLADSHSKCSTLRGEMYKSPHCTEGHQEIGRLNKHIFNADSNPGLLLFINHKHSNKPLNTWLLHLAPRKPWQHLIYLPWAKAMVNCKTERRRKQLQEEEQNEELKNKMSTVHSDRRISSTKIAIKYRRDYQHRISFRIEFL
jgi:hypothetical protein